MKDNPGYCTANEKCYAILKYMKCVLCNMHIGNVTQKNRERSMSKIKKCKKNKCHNHNKGYVNKCFLYSDIENCQTRKSPIAKLFKNIPIFASKIFQHSKDLKNKYTCAKCKKTFKKPVTKNTAIVCDDCYKKLMAKLN